MQAIQLPRSLNLCPQLIDPYASSSGDLSDFAAKVNDDFSQKLRLHDETPAPIDQQTAVNLGLIKNSLGSEKAAVVEDDDDEDDDFSFAPNSPDSSPVSADELFSDGQIRPVFPLHDRDLLFAAAAAEDQPPAATSLRPPLKKLFSERLDPMAPFSTDSAGEGPGKSAAEAEMVEESSPRVCKKCNSTGFSKLWRFRDIVRRSSSDGKDAFVFLNPSATATERKKITKDQKMEALKPLSEKKRTVKARAGKGTKTAMSAGVRTPKRRSYLPYRLGFFANVDGMSRNVHPF